LNLYSHFLHGGVGVGWGRNVSPFFFSPYSYLIILNSFPNTLYYYFHYIFFCVLFEFISCYMKEQNYFSCNTVHCFRVVVEEEEIVLGVTLNVVPTDSTWV
jgi:hypothetical protein